jgi:hypothetical protein
MVSKLIRLVAPLAFVVACGKDDPPPDRTPANAPGAPKEQAVLHDASVQTTEQPTFTHGVRGAPGMTVDTQDAGAAPTGGAPGPTAPAQPTTPPNAPGTPGGTQVVPAKPEAGTTKP